MMHKTRCRALAGKCIEALQCHSWNKRSSSETVAGPYYEFQRAAADLESLAEEIVRVMKAVCDRLQWQILTQLS
jgi:hypothetical protein